MSVQVSYKKQTVFFIILIFITLLAVEGIVRTINIIPATCQFNGNELFDEYDIFEKKRICYEYTTIGANYHTSIRLNTPNQFGTHLNINSDGFRGKDFDFQSDDYTIFVLGGSTTFGFITSSDDFTIPAILEKKLNDDNINVKVINAGMPGAYSRSELYLLENYILKYSPNMIIMYDGVNDGGHDIYNFTYDEFNKNDYFVNSQLEQYANQHKSSTGLLTFFAYIDYQTGIGLTQLFKSIITPKSEIPLPKNQEYEKEQSDILLLKEQRLQDNWSRVCALGKDNGFKTVNIIQPTLGYGKVLSDSEKLIVQEGTQFLKTLNLTKMKVPSCDEIWDLRYVFEEMNGTTIFFDSTHMTDFGNEIVADAIYKKILPIIKNDIQNK